MNAITVIAEEKNQNDIVSTVFGKIMNTWQLKRH
jgi:hypothetical protein